MAPPSAPALVIRDATSRDFSAVTEILAAAFAESPVRVGLIPLTNVGS